MQNWSKVDTNPNNFIYNSSNKLEPASRLDPILKAASEKPGHKSPSTAPETHISKQRFSRPSSRPPPTARQKFSAAFPSHPHWYRRKKRRATSIAVGRRKKTSMNKSMMWWRMDCGKWERRSEEERGSNVNRFSQKRTEICKRDLDEAEAYFEYEWLVSWLVLNTNLANSIITIFFREGGRKLLQDNYCMDGPSKQFFWLLTTYNIWEQLTHLTEQVITHPVMMNWGAETVP